MTTSTDDTRFLRAFEHVLGSEGGFTDDRQDPGNWTGGRIGQGQLKGTNFGISAASYPNEDIRGMTQARARQIYHRDYWSRCSCQLLPDGVAYVVFDCAVNHGVGRAIPWLQEAIGTAPDGKIGPHTRQMIGEIGGRADAVVREISAQRTHFYMELDQLNDRFGLGWARRAIDVAVKGDRFARSTEVAKLIVKIDELERQVGGLQAAKERLEAENQALRDHPPMMIQPDNVGIDMAREPDQSPPNDFGWAPGFIQRWMADRGRV
ncbi:MAG: glycosyl hydrolase 108 family protein [Pseudomonadota bacterium]